MKSTGARAWRVAAAGWALRLVLGLLAACALATLAQAQSGEPMPRPPQLERDVQFWVRVYSQIDTNAGFLHDQYNLAVVYDTLHFAPNSPPAERQRQVDEARNRYAAALRRIAAAGDGPLSADDQRIRELWGAEGTAGAPARCDRGHPLSARPGRSLPQRTDPLGRLGDAHRRDARQPGPAGRAGGAAARGVLVQPDGPTPRWAPPACGSSCARPAGATCASTARWTTVSIRSAPPRPPRSCSPTTTGCSAAGRWRSPPTTTAPPACATPRRRSPRTTSCASCAATPAAPSASPRATSTSRFSPRSRSTGIRRSTSAPLQKDGEARFQELEVPGYVSIASLERALKIDGGKLRDAQPGAAAVGMERRAARAQGLPAAPAARGRPVDAAAAGAAPDAGGPVRRTARAAALPRAGRRYARRARRALRRAHRDAGAHEPRAHQCAAVVRGASSTCRRRRRRSRSRPPPRPPPAPPAGAAQPARQRRIRDHRRSARTALAGGCGHRPTSPSARAPRTPRWPPPRPRTTSPTPQPPLRNRCRRRRPRRSGLRSGPAAETEQNADPTDYSVAHDGTIRVAAVETLGHYADWLGVTSARLREINHLQLPRPGAHRAAHPARLLRR